MKPLERIELVDKIGRDLQARMKWDDVTHFLGLYGVNTKKSYSGTNSKWVYVKEMLADVADEVVLKIANDLGLESVPLARNTDSKFWAPGHFRLFISHLSAFKVKASQLQASLKDYGISAFVAHEDIEPTKEWFSEIEAALFSMDALTALLSVGFHESKWTDHEIGVAIGREKLVIPVKRDMDPYGLFGKYQALNSRGLTVARVAELICEILLDNKRTRARYLDSLSELFLMSSSADDANRWYGVICRAGELPQKYLERLHQNIPGNKVIINEKSILEDLNKKFHATGLNALSLGTAEPIFTEDEIPF